ncbi:MAG: hypothetical protein ACJ0HH_02455 [Candidatus Thalassarchaeum sp.]
MRRAATALLIALLMVSSAPPAQATPKGVISCINADLSMMPANWDIDDQSCVRVDLGELQPYEILSFDLATDSSIDILLFSVNSISVYQNEQSYRSDAIWERNSVFEEFNGTGSWHWTVPDDRDPTRWYLVIDNLAHPQDSAGGAQGGSIASVTLDSSFVMPGPFTLADTIVRLSPGEHSILHGPFVVDAGTQVRMEANTMEGAPDVFLMTASQAEMYEQGGTAASRVQGTDMLLITQERDMVWLATETYEGEDLYLVVDNRAGPAGGGAGTETIAVTVMLSLTPILDPIIDSNVPLEVVDVGATVMLDASQTPNNSNQIPESGFRWDTDGDGVDDTTGSIVNVSWSNPTNLTIRLTVVATDARSMSSYQSIEVKDISDPEVGIGVTSTLERTYGEDVILSGQVSDNWGVNTVEWLIDSILMRTNSGDDEGATVFSYTFNESFAAGPHTVTMRATDNSGRVSEDTATVSLYDSTPPSIGDNPTEISLEIGETFRFEANASDTESPNLMYSWDLDDSVDSDLDGDSRNDADKFGDSVLWSYDASGPTTVVCRIENEAGLISEFEILVNVMSDAETDNSDLTRLLIMAAGGLVTLVVVAVLAWRVMSNRRLANMLAEQEEEEPVAPPSVEDQKAMWGGGYGGAAQSEPETQPQQQVFGDFSSGMSGSTKGITAAMGEEEDAEIDPDIAELLQTSLKSHSDSDAPSLSSDLMSAFEDDEAVEREEVEYSHEDNITDEVSKWEPGKDTANTEEPPSESQIQDRTVRQNCSSCEETFEVTMPPGVDAARTECPHCGSVESISLD